MAVAELMSNNIKQNARREITAKVRIITIHQQSIYGIQNVQFVNFLQFISRKTLMLTVGCTGVI